MSLTGDVSMNVLSTKAITVKLRIWSYLLKKSSMENLIFCAVSNNNGNSNINSRIYKMLVILITEMKIKINIY